MQMFYFIRQDQSNEIWWVLKIDRSKPTELNLVEYKVPYTAVNCVDGLLQWIRDDDKSTSALKHVTKCYGIVGFFKFLGPYYMLLITDRSKIGSIYVHDVYSVDKSEIIRIPAPDVLPSVAYSSDEKRYLSRFSSVNISKDFFFSYNYNLAQTLQKNITEKNGFGSQNDTMFVWNNFLTEGFREQINSPVWTVALVHGFFRQEKVSGLVEEFLLTIIARRSQHFVGPRFFKRGINKKGMVANDVEIEQIVSKETKGQIALQMTSIVQRRGSIPLFWSQETQKCPIKPDILLKPDEDYNATCLHFKNLKTRYGEQIIILNLIKSFEKKPYESLLRSEFEQAIDHINKDLSTHHKILFVHLDMKKYSRSHEVLPFLVKIGSEALRQTSIFQCQITVSNSQDNTREVLWDSLQKGVLRTNCLDCLDRTNSAQFAYGLTCLSHQLRALGLIAESDEIAINDPLSHFLMDFYEQMGDTLSMQYAGSTALNKVFWKQRGQCGVISLVQEFFRSLQRFLNNALMDREKQNALDLFLGYFQPQQGMLSVPNICGDGESLDNEEYSGNPSRVQRRDLLAEGQNGSSELNMKRLFYSNFVDFNGLS